MKTKDLLSEKHERNDSETLLTLAIRVTFMVFFSDLCNSLPPTLTHREKNGSLCSSWQPSNHWQKSRKRERKNKYSRSKVSSWNERENVFCKYFYWLLIDRDDSELLSIKSREKMKGKSLFHLIGWLWMGFLSSLSSFKRTRWDFSQIFNMTTSFHFDCVTCARELFRGPIFRSLIYRF